ncbi:hypothetical protein, partial [Streptomyces sp. NPDC007070]|uniref:hypothetical protein n=1 Tax=Streptomyces sp. NPDC007070 TaxID=3154312 RepID=UPI0033CC49B1
MGGTDVNGGDVDDDELTLDDGTPVRREGKELGRGGQGGVWAVAERPDLAVKIYDRPPSDQQVRRLVAMLRARPLAAEHLRPGQPPLLAWPTALVQAGGRPVGYAMPRLDTAGHVHLNGLLQKQVRLRRFEDTAHWKFLLGVAANLAYMTARLHVERFVVGDLSSTNAVADRTGFITLLDCDSFAFADPLTREKFDCEVLTDDYSGPERHDGRPPTRHSDDFALAVLVYQLLTAGNHPFDGSPKHGAADSVRKDNIVTGTTFLIHPDRVVTPVQLLPTDVLPPKVVRLARAAFGPGLHQLARRPSSAAWLAALDEARQDVVRCEAEPMHYYGGHLDSCPWCRRRGERGTDPFTGTARRNAGTASASTSASVPASASAPAPVRASPSVPRSPGTGAARPAATSASAPPDGGAKAAVNKAAGAKPHGARPSGAARLPWCWPTRTATSPSTGCPTSNP